MAEQRGGVVDAEWVQGVWVNIVGARLIDQFAQFFAPVFYAQPVRKRPECAGLRAVLHGVDRLLEQHDGLAFFQHLLFCRQAGFEGEAFQQAAADAVDGADAGLADSMG